MYAHQWFCNILSIFTWQSYLFPCHIYVNSSWNICVRNFEFYTHMHLCMLCMHNNNMDNIPSTCIIHLAPIFVLTFMSVNSWNICDTMNFTHICACVHFVYTSVICTSFQVFFIWQPCLLLLHLCQMTPEVYVFHNWNFTYVIMYHAYANQ